MMIRTVLGVLSLTSLATACDGGGGDDDDDDDDRAMLVGHWVSIDLSETPDMVMDFTDEGAFQLAIDLDMQDVEPVVVSGDYEVSGDDLVLSYVNPDDDLPEEQRYTFYVSGDVFGFPACLPDGAHSGVVGTWHCANPDDSYNRELVLTFDGDGTGHATVSYQGAGAPPVVDVDMTYALEGDRYLLSAPGVDLPLLTLLDDEALVNVVFNRE